MWPRPNVSNFLRFKRFCKSLDVVSCKVTIKTFLTVMLCWLCTWRLCWRVDRWILPFPSGSATGGGNLRAENIKMVNVVRECCTARSLMAQFVWQEDTAARLSYERFHWHTLCSYCVRRIAIMALAHMQRNKTEQHKTRWSNLCCSIAVYVNPCNKMQSLYRFVHICMTVDMIVLIV